MSESSPEGLDEYDEEFSDAERRLRRNVFDSFCRHCHRMEQHLLLPSTRATFPLTVLFTAGMVYWFGPFGCLCCGRRRIFRTTATRYRRLPVSYRERRTDYLQYHRSDRQWQRLQRRARCRARLRRLLHYLGRPFRRRDSFRRSRYRR